MTALGREPPDAPPDVRGFFLYVGASDLTPESHHAHLQALTTVMTLLGAASLYAVARLADA
jgi:hypothetical protein